MGVSGIMRQRKVILHQVGKTVYNQVLEGMPSVGRWCGWQSSISGRSILADTYLPFFGLLYKLTVAPSFMAELVNY